MLQSITCQDERGQTLSRGMKMVRGGMQDNGPITTLSGDGKDLSLTYQGYAALDNVAFVNGNQLGRRCILQVGGQAIITAMGVILTVYDYIMVVEYHGYEMYAN